MPVDPWAKDCGCITHDGPHWLSMDEYWRAKNQEMRDRMQEHEASGDHLAAYYAALGYAREEEQRLGALVNEMRSRGIDRIPPEVRGRVRRSRAEYVECRRAEIERRKREDAARAEARLSEAAAEYEHATADRRTALRDEMTTLQQTLTHAGAV